MFLPLHSEVDPRACAVPHGRVRASHELLVDPKGQVKTEVYSPNYTSKHQPQDMGIISELHHYAALQEEDTSQHTGVDHVYRRHAAYAGKKA